MKKFFLFLIILLSFALRIAYLSKYPSGFSLDEISQGYTAYSILKTGKDEWGVIFPLAPRAFGDFRSPLYTYLTIPFVAVFGLNEFSVRFPSVVFGTLAVLSVYLLVKEFFRDNKKSEDLALLSSLFLAISPWHISLSRGAFEASLNAFFLPFGIWLFLKGLKNWWLFIPSSIIFGINLFSYYSPRFFTPLVILILLLHFKKDFFKKTIFIKNFLFLGVFGFFLSLSFLTLMAGGKTRVSDTSIFNPTGGWGNLSNRQYEAIWSGMPSLIERIFNNKISDSFNQFYKHYLNYFSFNFLFTDGPSEATYGMISGRGVLYSFELPLILIAIFSILKTKDKRWYLILTFLLLSPISASLAKGERAGNRASTMMPFLQIISAYGAVLLFGLVERILSKKIYLLSFFLMIGVFLTFFLEDYFYHAPKNNAPNMSYGWSEVYDYLAKNMGGFSKIIVSKRFSEPQIALAFYLKIDPRIVQRQSLQWLDYEKKGFLFVDQLPEYSLENFEFRNFHFSEDAMLKNTLFIGKEEDFAGIGGETKKLIYYPGPEKKIAFKIVSFDIK